MSEATDRAYFARKQEVDTAMRQYERDLIAWQQDAPNREAAKAENARRTAEWEQQQKEQADLVAKETTQRSQIFVTGEDYEPSLSRKRAMGEGVYAQRVKDTWVTFQVEVQQQQPTNPLSEREIAHVQDFCRRNFVDQSSLDGLRRVLGHLCRVGIVQRSPEDWRTE